MEQDALGASPGAPDTNVSSPGPGPANNDAPAASPSDASQKGPDSDRAALLEVVQKVVGQPAESTVENPQGETEAAKTTADPANPASQPTTSSASQDPLDVDPTDQEMGALVPKTRKRVERLLSQRNSARAETDVLREPAKNWNEFSGYLDQHKLAPADVNLLLGVGAALRRGDMKAFRDGIAPYWKLANEALGDALPQDLSEKVQNGEMTAEVAAEMTRLRHSQMRAEGEVKITQERTQHAETETRVRDVTNAVTQWENGIKQRDPDYGSKADAVLRSSQARLADVLRSGAPYTPDLAVKIAQEAYEEVNGWFQRAAPQRTATRQAPDGTRSSINGGARAEPRSLMEAALRGLELARLH